MTKAIALAGTSLSLIGLYLVLKNATGSTAVIKALSGGTVQIFRTLQGNA